MSPTATRILVVANETCLDPALCEFLASRARDEPVDVLVVAPALNTRLRHWTSDTRRAVEAAEERLVVSLACLAQERVHARGFVGDADPLLAARDALELFHADEVVVVTHPPGLSNWLERDVVDRARRELPLPVHHLVAGEARVLVAA